MKTLIVYCHPNHDSLNYAFFKTAKESIEQSGDEVQVLDLYAENFDPILVFNKEKRRRDMHIDPDMEKYREQIRWADRMVYIYPIFWGRPPAMLLGYFDRVMSTNFAYRPIEGKPLPEGLLKGKEAVCIYTMAGPSFYPGLLLGNAPKHVMKSAIFSYTGIKKVKMFQFGGMEKPGAHIEKKLKKVADFFAS